ncbi:hypothetical protein ABH926_006047 [Catenulispora sp. GP43]|uniref:hypothetical protein n=1 Tax=Catenulispora sp. GP43 TaxID=3156263 RepID=UPI0035192989
MSAAFSGLRSPRRRGSTPRVFMDAPWVPLGVAVAVVALLVIGVRPRLAEYR